MTQTGEQERYIKQQIWLSAGGRLAECVGIRVPSASGSARARLPIPVIARTLVDFDAAWLDSAIDLTEQNRYRKDERASEWANALNDEEKGEFVAL